MFAVTGISLLLLLVSCAAPLKQFYHDTYFPEDHIYENRPIGFLLKFRGNWSITTDPDSMNKVYRDFARTMRNSGGELLFMGSSTEGLYGVKAIAINLNEPPAEYARYIRNLNGADVQNNNDPVEFLAGEHMMVKWVYDKSGYRFVEFFFVVDTYDIRLSFWTRPALFDGFLPVFEDIAASLAPVTGLD
jgi:hypothetical protein